MRAVFALAGNPNCGKTTLFNELTGSRQHVGNWPGVTVEKKEGFIKPRWMDTKVVDLPGLYSLSPYSPEELAARRFLIESKPDVIINIVDATNLERNLYLTLQLAELGRPMVIALNMTDRLRSTGVQIDVGLLEKALGIPVVPISASKGQGLRQLTEAAQLAMQTGRQSDGTDSFYPIPVMTAISEIEKIIARRCIIHGIPVRFAAAKLLDGDTAIADTLKLTQNEYHRFEQVAHKLESRFGERDMIIADQKYRFIGRLCTGCVQRLNKDNKPTASDRIDRVTTHRLLSLPLFLFLMVLIFFLTFGPLGSWLSEGLESIITDMLVPLIRESLDGIGAAGWLVSLLCDGILSGVGSVVSFLPQLLLLFFFLSLLEDSGYMARAAFLMDRILCKTGLSGKSFVPMLMGFGCTVSGVMAARTLNSKRDRYMTVLLTPFLSCSAKMPVYSMMTAAFFPGYFGVIVITGLYATGVSVALITARTLSKTVFRGDHSPFMLELPPYRFPTMKNMWRSMSERIRDFAARAGSVLLLASVAIWFLREFDMSLNRIPQNCGTSILASVGQLLVPLLAPLGLGYWQVGVALLTGLLAKEAIVGTLSILYSPAAGESISIALQSAFTPVSALSFLTFVLLYAPCIAAFSATRRELRSTKLAVGWAAIQTCIAWFAAFMVYQFGTLGVTLIHQVFHVYS